MSFGIEVIRPEDLRFHKSENRDHTNSTFSSDHSDCLDTADFFDIYTAEIEKSSHTNLLAQVFERTISVLLLVLFAPLLFLLSSLVRLTSPGPAIISENRIGFQGKKFKAYKLRTMNIHSETSLGAAWPTPFDARLTPVGRVLRFLNLDEIPQLFNVAKGDMRLVGPRPERPEIVAKCADLIGSFYFDRFSVPPGVSGLAQLFIPFPKSAAEVQDSLKFDRYYVRNRTAWMNIQLLTAALATMLGLRSRLAIEFLGLDRIVRDHDAITFSGPMPISDMRSTMIESELHTQSSFIASAKNRLDSTMRDLHLQTAYLRTLLVVEPINNVVNDDKQ